MGTENKTYKFKEIFYTLQGEGHHSGRPAVFCRFTGCNLWTGREEDRENAICDFCDTDFLGMDGKNGGTYSVDALIEKIFALWPSGKINPFIVCTGGEPLLQIDKKFLDAIHLAGIEIAVETNGTIIPPQGIDWICVSPKQGSDVRLKSGDELKLVYPQEGFPPQLFESWDFEHFYLQPMDGPYLTENTTMTVQYCKNHPHWKMSIQSHKYLGID